jgi:DNA-binding NarL/FixJ family response regulator
MPPDNTDDGLRAALTIRDEQPGTAVLVLSQYIEDQYAIELIGEGHEGVGYLLKERITDVSALLEAVHRIAAGGSVIDPQVVSQLLRRHRREDPLELLSDREREVLSLMAEGRSNNAIASELVVTDRAVEKHVTSIFSKLDLPPAEQDHRRVLAVLRFLRA